MNDYKRWIEMAKDPSVKEELQKMDEGEIQDAFYKDLEFGTGGLRGLLGAGPNRLNVYTIGKISQGISDYINRNFAIKSVAISYDSRINSTLFAKTAAEVFAANGIEVFIFKELMPTPLLSYAVRYHHCSMGVMITASHNPRQYNGYKVYNSDGCQITLDAANEIIGYVDKIDLFTGVKKIAFENGLTNKTIRWIEDDCLETYLEYIDTKRIASISSRDLSIVYSPLNGTGLVPVTKALSRFGFANVSVVPEQRDPDGNFTTCPKPNPELKETLALGIRDMKEKNVDLLLVTDPDCDRVGTAIFHHGDVRLLNGNEIGILMYDFLLAHKKASSDSLVIKTIVTTDMIFPMATEHHMAVKEVLTGFKFIGEQIGFLEKTNQKDRFFMGFEESYGYLTGTEVRDKDAVDGAVIIAQMFQYYKQRHIDAVDRLESLYQKYGYCLTSLDSFEFVGQTGSMRMGNLMESLRREYENKRDSYAFVNDYLTSRRYVKDSLSEIDLPSSNVIKIGYADGSTITIRPSGTEPKLKIYYYIVSKDKELLQKKLLDRQTEMKTKVAAFE
jgi:phosphoglucomutase